MADKKISALTGATTPLAGTEVLPIVQSGATVKVSVDNLTTGKTVYAKNVDLTAGRLFLDQDYQITWRNGATNRGRIYIDSGNTIGFESGASNTTRMAIDSSGNTTISTGNLVIGTSGKGITDSTGTTTLNFTSTGTQLAGAQQTSTGVFNNVGTAQNIAIATGQAGFIVVTGVQGGVGASSWTVPFVNRLGTTAVSAAPTKAVVTADPISTVTASGANIVITPLAANTYISYAIYYTPCAV